ncbi:GtrA family protein [Thalassospira profundimaris]|uniref:GtrA/DPMS transmembrane domain-containing protein n=1 Tax=Thalassospira profundimaris TaxID=502049 RepID=A0A367X0D8_9PROT|nr:GtrA family protein [Thalassospira profundimaris]RCK47107.1 hypothetical protein TH30_06320 [Thalassospira profundimaris]
MRKSLIEAVKFGAVGVINTAIGLSVIYALTYFTDISYFLANFAGYAVGLAVSYQLNKIWTFSAKSSRTRYQFAAYIIAAACCYVANLAVLYMSVRFVGLNEYLSQLSGIATYSVSMFLISKFIVFAPTDRKELSQ